MFADKLVTINGNKISKTTSKKTQKLQLLHTTRYSTKNRSVSLEECRQKHKKTTQKH
jgi:hypothetical protein